MEAIMAIILSEEHSKQQYKKEDNKVDTYNGCKVLIPNLPAKAPVMNGNMAEPA
jgi:hypothetical protein